MPISILKTKLYAPAFRKNIVSRSRLLDALNNGLAAERKLSFILAPAGFGKTTLASDWISQCELPCAWLSLDAEDRDVFRFLNYLVAALQSIDKEIGQSVSTMIKSASSIEAILTVLINEIANLPQKFVVVLDDYHLTDTKEVGALLDFLLTHMPVKMHLLIISRKELDVPIARLRALNQVTEVGANELLLTDREIESFLSMTMELSLPFEIVERLKVSTEGWVAGLQLAAISMSEKKDHDHFETSFSGSHQFVFDFLFEEVFSRQPENIQNFLISIANLNRMSASLCDAVLNDSNVISSDILDYLQRVNLFVVPLDEERHWFRFHHLFHDSLRHLQTRRLNANEIAILHLRASTWFEIHGEISDSFRHAIASQSYSHVAQLAEKCWETLSQNFHSTTWLDWVKKIPEEVIATRPVLCVQIAWSLMDAGNFELSEMRLREAEYCLTQTRDEFIVVDQVQFQALPARIAFVRAYNAQNRRDIGATIRYAELVLQLSPVDENHLIRAQARAILAATYWMSGELDAANLSLTEWVDNAKRAGNAFFAIAGASGKAEILLTQGKLADALVVYQQALQDAAATEGGAQQIISHHLLGLALVNHEIGNDDIAREFLQQSAEAGKSSTLPDWLYRYHIALARFSESQGDFDAALKYLDEAQRHFVATLVPETHPIETLKAAVYIKQGGLQRAQMWMRKSQLSILDELDYVREFGHLTMIRVIMAEWQIQADELSVRAVLDMLERLQVLAEKQNRLKSILEILKLKAQIHAFLGKQVEALDIVAQILQLAKPESFIRLFVDEGQNMHTLLMAFRSKLTENTKLRTRYATYLDRILSALSRQLTISPDSIVEPLSQRELAVLKLIAEGHSNEEICAQLFLALDTVKGHNRRIFNKLQVRRRTEAVIRAQKLGLL